MRKNQMLNNKNKRCINKGRVRQKEEGIFTRLSKKIKKKNVVVFL